MITRNPCLPILLIVVLALTGCAATLKKEMEVDSYLCTQCYELAIQNLAGNEKDFGDKNRLLFLLNAGALNHYAGRYKESNVHFEEAYELAENLYTKSISAEAAAKISPNMRSYYGEDYEKVMINTFMALNYLFLGDLEGALVEARRIDLSLELLTQKYEGKNKYKNDAFGRYLAGIVQELDGQINDAYISYVQALDAYEDYQGMFDFATPRQIKRDIVRLANTLGFNDQYDRYLERFGDSFDCRSIAGDYDNNGEIVFISLTGLGPFKQEKKETFAYVDGKGKTHTFQVQIPILIDRPSNILEVKIDCDSLPDLSGNAEIVQDVGKIARKNMEDKKTRMLIEAWGRAFAKFLATEEAKKKTEGHGWLATLTASLFIDMAAESLTRADIRCWRTIPQRIYLYRIRVPVGSYDFTVSYRGELGPIGHSIHEHININRKGGAAVLYFKEFN